jgi:hypothetical protein
MARDRAPADPEASPAASSQDQREADVMSATVKQRATYELPRLALSIEEACGALGISWDLWREHVAADVRVVRIGRRRLVPVAELQKWLAEHAERALPDDRADGVDRTGP